jgi:hypothetical protein
MAWAALWAEVDRYGPIRNMFYFWLLIFTILLFREFNGWAKTRRVYCNTAYGAVRSLLGFSEVVRRRVRNAAIVTPDWNRWTPPGVY